MNILQINNCHYRRGGADIVYLNTIQLLSDYGYEVCSFAAKGVSDEETSAKEYFCEPSQYASSALVNRVSSVPDFFYNRKNIKLLNAIVRENKIDIAHMHTYKGSISSSVVDVLVSLGVKICLTVHDFGLLCPHNTMIDGRGKTCTRCLDSGNPLHVIAHKCNKGKIIDSSVSALEYIFSEKVVSVSEKIDKIIAPSQFIYDLHSRDERFRNKINYICNFNPRVDVAPPSLNIKANAPILFLGRLASEKGVSTLLEALRCTGFAGRRCLVAGDGPDSESLKKFRDQNELGFVEFLGHVNADVTESLIRDAYVNVVPSEWFENNPLSVIESLSLGTPVIGADIGGIPELVKPGVTGVLFESGNSKSLAGALTEICSLKSCDYLNLRSSCYEFARKKFDAKAHLDQLREVYAD